MIPPEIPPLGPEAAGPLAPAEPADASARSPLEVQLDALERYLTDEGETLGTYRQLAASSSDPVVATALRLLLEDKEHHHDLVRRTAVTLRDSLYWTHSPEALPVNEPEGKAAGPEAAEAIRGLLAQERSSGDRVDQLVRDAEPGRDLYSLLLETLAMDHRKHERILRFVLDQLGRRA